MKFSLLLVTFLSLSVWAQNPVVKKDVKAEEKEDKFATLMKELEQNSRVNKTQYATLNTLHASLVSDNSIIQEQNKLLVDLDCTEMPQKRTDFVELSHQILVTEMKKLIKEIERKIKKEQFYALQDESDLLETNQIDLLTEQARLVADCVAKKGKKENKVLNPNLNPEDKIKKNQPTEKKDDKPGIQKG